MALESLIEVAKLVFHMAFNPEDVKLYKLMDDMDKKM